MKQKIILSLNQKELEKFITIVQGSQIRELDNLVKLVIGKTDKDGYIKRRVYEALSDLSGFEIDYIKDNQSLKTDLGLTIYHKKSLKRYFQRIVRDLKSNKTVTVIECEKLTKVSDCIKLVKSKI
ncbi:hypothetical protein ATO12_09955 [Aquimarina atlantica]|uniref:Uncharacterized protein n=1 Tax=Aquimarina atlantica TaxID=1317122 RepID=A0A023BYC3_9FLAO|nr:hypothetical protein [Aquimarina atlantica]EZH75041.1 hypothetical protein ATO12_09955 [Aquimarina atlantica]